MSQPPADANVVEATLRWIDLGTVEAVFSGAPCKSLLLEEREIGLFRVGDQVFALEDLCTHGRALLSEGDLQGYEIECPLHAAVFDVRSGAVLCAPATRPQKPYPVRLAQGHVLIYLDT